MQGICFVNPHGNLCSEAIDVFTTAKEGGTLNVSQQIDRMKPADDNLVGCITPAAQIWFLGKNRLMTGQGLFQFAISKTSVIVANIFQMLASKIQICCRL